jgi:hypothetical protein
MGMASPMDSEGRDSGRPASTGAAAHGQPSSAAAPGAPARGSDRPCLPVQAPRLLRRLGFRERMRGPEQERRAEKARSFYAALRLVRAEVQDLWGVLRLVRAGKSDMASHAGYVARAVGDIAELMEFDTPETQHADTVARIRNTWEQMMQTPLLAQPDGDFTARELLHQLDSVEGQVRLIEYYVGMVTIPNRLNAWLRSTRPGYYVPFHLVFEDELPNAEDRARLLMYLASAPGTVRNGIVDPSTGLVYRYAASPVERVASCALVAVVVWALTMAVAHADSVPAAGWPIAQGDTGALMVGWWALLGGMLLHLGVGSTKRRQASRGLPPVIAVGDLLRVVDARCGQIALKLLFGGMGLFGLCLVAGIAEVTPLNAFLVGYSLDSFVEVFGATMEQRAEAQMSVLKSRLGAG